MPVLHLKNKVTRTLMNTVEKALSVGGIPDYITLEPKEALQLLKEIQELTEIKDFFKFEQTDIFDEAEPEVRFLMKQVNHETRLKVRDRWFRKQYTLSYLHSKKQQQNGAHAQAIVKREDDVSIIPLILVNPKPKTEDKPNGVEKDSTPPT